MPEVYRIKLVRAV